jgi:broad specificity phosphatase PhoE
MTENFRSVWFVRHGNRLDFVDPTWEQSVDYPIDSPLAPDGHVQARETAAFLKDKSITHIFASPFLRTMETATAIADALDLPIKVEPGLREKLLLRWFPKYPEVLSAQELARKFPRVDVGYTPRCEPQWPETEAQAGVRGAQTVNRLVQDFSGHLLFVSHGGAIGNLCRGLIPTGELDIHTSMCCLIEFKQTADCWVVKRSGHDTTHLSQTEDEIRVF